MPQPTFQDFQSFQPASKPAFAMCSAEREVQEAWEAAAHAKAGQDELRAHAAELQEQALQLGPLQTQVLL